MLQKPEKIYLNNTNLAFALSPLQPNTGNLWETFFLSQLVNGHMVSAPEQGDFLIDGKFLFEIGGKQKNHAQIAGVDNSFVVRDDVEFPVGKSIPLWLTGCLY